MSKEWISKALKCQMSCVEELYKAEFATTFLMTWSLFESKCIKNSINEKSIKEFCKTMKSVDQENEKILKGHFFYFHDRYQNRKWLENLDHSESKWFRDLTRKIGDDITNEDKIAYILFVVQRFRNNLFHGRKGIGLWYEHKEHIEKCIEIMQIIYDTNVES